MTRNELLDEMADIMDLDPGALEESDKLDDLPWTSLTAMAYVAFCDYRLNVSPSTSEIQRCTCVKDLMDLAKDHLEDQ